MIAGLININKIIIIIRYIIDIIVDNYFKDVLPIVAGET